MLKKILSKMGYVKAADIKQEPVITKPERPTQFFKTEDIGGNTEERIAELWDLTFNKSVHPLIKGVATDSAGVAMDSGIKRSYQTNGLIPPVQLLWYASQTFIGYQMCAILSQQWLIAKACLMPAKDATRKGFLLTVNDGTEVEPDVLDEIRRLDVTYKLNKNLIQFVQMGRVFGIRIALFEVETTDPIEYYKNPFNPDGVKPGSYRGISQIDPYWITPQFDAQDTANPAAINFYEPTWWVISGRLVHRSHLIIYRTEEVPDILKPSYIYGGIPIPQKIAERVYASERTANEAPMLAMTKRTDVMKTDLSKATAQYSDFSQRMQRWTAMRDNYGVKFIDTEDDMLQFDTSLTDLDATIMTQYQLVAAASNVPVTKLLGTTPKGFNATGEFDEASYHEELESIQTHDLSPLIERHHLLLIRSEIVPKFGIEPFHTTVTWNKLDAMTAAEKAEVNHRKAETGQLLIESGAIDSEDERLRVMGDPDSDYTGLNDEVEDSGTEELSDLTGA